ncbi:M23 family metallopeptidase [Phenylobacterium sp. VNQ135]|uniref:M23 family metallopeptidase n=1 Tax=Phenylobacterium sp. VNQ135 TaxID=3400922 RepID=UPI003C121672
MRAVSLVALLTLAACGGASPQAEAQGSASLPAAAAGPTPPPSTDPAAPHFAFPVACRIGHDCVIQHYVDRDPGPGSLDYHCGPHTYDTHTGVDFRVADIPAQQRGVDVLAAAPGRVLRVRDGVEDVFKTPDQINPKDPIGLGNAVVIDHGNGWLSAYGHMAKGSVRVKPGDAVTTGQPVGRIGLSGLTEFPHLHFEVRHNGAIADPFGPEAVAAGACPNQASLWTADAAAQMPYADAFILNAGFTSEQVGMRQVEEGAIPPASAEGPALIAYARTVMMRAGDTVESTLLGPKGEVIARSVTEPLTRTRAQDLRIIGKRRPAEGFAPGAYRAQFRVLRNGRVVAERTVETRV